MKLVFRILALIAVFCAVFLPLEAQNFDGYALYNKLNNNTAYLVDKDGNIAKSWNCARPCNYAVRLKPNGNIVRGAVNASNVINGAAVGGTIQEIDPQGNIVWQFDYSNSSHVSHHDFTLLPNGNVILTAWEVKTLQELQALGYLGSSQKYATHFIEVQQVGTGGQIVWEWHIWDHLIQDVDPNKPNYGVVADHPELLDINVQTTGMGGPGGGSDWFHENGIDYNPELDQIVFSSRFLSEIFIIDHSASTQEAASHSGGNAGMGGDFLYRWGKPANYDTPGTQTIAGPVHDSHWIEPGRANAGYIQIFNNIGGPGGSSVVDAINPLRVGYNYTRTPGQAFGPTTYDWRHTCRSNAGGQSASDRLPDGNTFVNLSGGYMYEVDSLNNLVWQFAEGPAKAFRYVCSDSGIIALLGNDPCHLVGVSDPSPEKIDLIPNPSQGNFEVSGLTQGHSVAEIVVFDIHGNRIRTFTGTHRFDLSGQANGIYIASIRLDSGQKISKKVFLLK